MSHRTLAYLSDAWLEFYLSRQAMNCTAATLEFYNMTAYKFLIWIESQGVQSPDQIESTHVRQFLADMDQYKDASKHAYARAIKTLLIFWHNDQIIPQHIRFEMPKLTKKVLPYLTEEELLKIINVCNTRDRAMMMFMADCGIRVSELCKLNWEDVNFQNGLVRIYQGKGQKDRAVVVGVNVLRALLKYRRSIQWTNTTPLFLSRFRKRLTRTGVLIICKRLRTETGIYFYPHALRRTYVMLSLKNHADPGHIQRMLGHGSLDMVYYYADMANINLLQVQHKGTSPIDNII